MIQIKLTRAKIHRVKEIIDEVTAYALTSLLRNLISIKAC